MSAWTPNVAYRPNDRVTVGERDTFARAFAKTLKRGTHWGRRPLRNRLYYLRKRPPVSAVYEVRL